MPDYGDDRGFRSRGVPSDIGFDRAGPVRGTNYNEGYRPGDITQSDLPPRMPTPIQSGGPGGEFGGSQRLYTGRNPFMTPNDPGMDFGAPPRGGGRLIEGGPFGEWKYGTPKEVTPMSSSEFLTSRFGGGLDDAAGMNDDARGMIEDAGFDVASSPGMTDKRMEKKLWGKAVNSFPPGTPDMILQQEWERLKQIYRDKKYGGGTGLALPSRDDIVGLG